MSEEKNVVERVRALMAERAEHVAAVVRIDAELAPIRQALGVSLGRHVREPRATNHEGRVLALARERVDGIGVQHVMDGLGVKRAHAYVVLSHLTEAGHLRRVRRGVWTLPGLAS